MLQQLQEDSILVAHRSLAKTLSFISCLSSLHLDVRPTFGSGDASVLLFHVGRGVAAQHGLHILLRWWHLVAEPEMLHFATAWRLPGRRRQDRTMGTQPVTFTRNDVPTMTDQPVLRTQCEPWINQPQRVDREYCIPQKPNWFSPSLSGRR